ncbi:MAG: DUF523 and DUF1722 domain-containing protein [bacterium]|nr:DUF523 and DUF1722 domain-containing protein [bacterium]
MQKPKIVLSRCFSEPVRYNGERVNNNFVNRLKEFVDFIDFCPEVDTGLGVPRKRVSIIEIDGLKKLIQTETGKDLTDIITEYSQKVINSLKEIDGFILKAKSPSCGVGSARLYRNNSFIGKTSGFFAEKIKNHFYYLPVEDENRLRDESIREHFLIRIFAFAELRALLNNPTPKNLVDFHTRYKYLLMTYSQRYLKEIGQIVADNSIPFEEKIIRYRQKFYESFLRKPSPKRHINTLMHITGYISKNLNPEEKKHLHSLIERYIKGRLPLNVITELLKSFVYRFGNEYLLYQKYLHPYPEELNV